MEVEYEHVIPKSSGGSYTINNIRQVCINCNRGKNGMKNTNMYNYIMNNNLPGTKNIMIENIKSMVNNQSDVISNNQPNYKSNLNL